MNKYELSHKEYKECLNIAILGIFSAGKASKKPTSFFIVGQPGAGKSGLASSTEMEFKKVQGEEIVKIDPDVVAVYHQNYEEIISEIPEQSYTELQKFINPALKEIRKVADEQRVNTITEGTFADTPEYLRIIQGQLEKGYSIEINIMAVHRLESLISALERQQERIVHNLPPRNVSIEHHDRAYNSIYTTLKEVEQRKMASKISVYRRGENEMQPKAVYTTGDNKYRNSIEALEQEREKDLKDLLADKEKFKKRIEILKEDIAKNPENEVKNVMLQQLAHIEETFEKEVQKEQIKTR